MSKHETPMIRWYWHQTGGTLIEEFPAVRKSDSCGPRLIDGVIIKDGEKRIAHHSEVTLEGKDIIIIQAKAGRLGMYLMGQTLFSRSLMEIFRPRSVVSIALCGKDDSVLRPLLEKYEGCKVVVYQQLS
jgi:hypothetical protein